MSETKLLIFLPRNTINSVQSLSRVRLFATPWTATHQASLSITNSRSLLKLMSIALVMPFNHLIHYHPHLLTPSIFPSIRVFPHESVLPIKWPKYWSFSISPSNKYSGLISFRIDRFGVNYNTHYLRDKIKLLNSYKMLKIKMLDGLVSG